MKIELAGIRLEMVEFDYTMRLAFSGGWEVRVETPFQLSTRAGATSVDPGEDAERGGPLMAALSGRAVDEAHVSESGVLTLNFDEGTVLTIQPDSDYEAWTVAGPKGQKLVSLPGGEVATWSAEPDGSAS
jgi:hypothetical protein